MKNEFLRLKKGEDRRIRAGHPWIFSNEIDTAVTPLSSFTKGQQVVVQAHDKSLVGAAYVNPHSLIAARLFSRDPHERLDIGFFIHKIKAALALRHRLFSKPYYRLIFGEADELPGLVVDRFGNELACQINTAGMDQQTSLIAEALCIVLPETTSILLRNDSPIREYEGLKLSIEPIYGDAPDIVTLEENHIRFTAPFLKGQKTSWFYDHRDNRKKLKKYVAGKKVLDVFSYLGAFGIQAAAFGATKVDCIEASTFAGQFILQNAKLNEIESKVKLINEDAFDAMKTLIDSRKLYDVIILDPPAFVKKNKDRKEGIVAYQRINELALKLLANDGILFSCSCSMHISMDELMQVLQRAAFKTQSSLQVLERGHQGLDHPIHLAIPETDYLKAIVVRKL